MARRGEVLKASRMGDEKRHAALLHSTSVAQSAVGRVAPNQYFVQLIHFCFHTTTPDVALTETRLAHALER